MTTTIAPSGIRCGNHPGEKIYHKSIADVRICSSSMQTSDWHTLDLEKAIDQQHEMRAREIEPEAPSKITQDGMYRNPVTQEIFKVQWNRGQGDGRRLYAKQLHMHFWDEQSQQFKTWTQIPLEGEKIADASTEFVYAPGARDKLRPEWRMSMEEAKAFGALYGTCMRCGRALTLEESIERAMGSTCAKKANWA